MGMAAGQARLLTITARLNNNELRSMHLTNAKIRLADTTEKVGEDYINALNDSQLLYSTYDTNGNISYEKLTGNSLSYYGPLKNQYGLVNSAGQIMVSELDGKNFKESDNLEEFLDKYGLLGSLDQGKVIQVKNPGYDEAWADYNTARGEWVTKEPIKDDYKTVIKGYDEYLDYSKWNSTSSLFATAVADPSNPLYSGGDYCMLYSCRYTIGLLRGYDLANKGVNPSDKISYTTSDGNTMKIFNWDNPEDAAQLNNNPFDYLNATYFRTPDNPGGFSPEVFEDWSTAITDGAKLTETQYNQLIDFLYKTITSLCATSSSPHNSGSVNLNTDKLEGDHLTPNNSDANATIVRLREILGITLEKRENPDKNTVEFDEKGYNEAYKEWTESEPQKPTVEPYLEKVVRQINDNDKGQWYVNLWHRMNGESDYKSGYMNLDKYDENFDGWISDSKTNENYTVLEDGLMNSPEWLKFALEHGAITLEKVQFSDPSIAGDGLKNVQWVSTIYSSVTDIVEQKNEKAATLAEVRYNQAMREIESKDKEYDNQIKLLDTEHNALQTEYDSVKGTIEKNVERTFKAFS